MISAFDIVFAHFRRIIECNTEELGERIVVVTHSPVSVVIIGLLPAQTINQCLAIVFDICAGRLVDPSGSGCLKIDFAVLSLQMSNQCHSSSTRRKFGK